MIYTFKINPILESDETDADFEDDGPDSGDETGLDINADGSYGKCPKCGGSGKFFSGAPDKSGSKNNPLTDPTSRHSSQIHASHESRFVIDPIDHTLFED